MAKKMLAVGSLFLSSWVLVAAQQPQIAPHQLKQIAIDALRTRIIEKSLPESWANVPASPPSRIKGSTGWFISFRNSNLSPVQVIKVEIHQDGRIKSIKSEN